jgi:hypothetical protein
VHSTVVTFVCSCVKDRSTKVCSASFAVSATPARDGVQSLGYVTCPLHSHTNLPPQLQGRKNARHGWARELLEFAWQGSASQPTHHTYASDCAHATRFPQAWRRPAEDQTLERLRTGRRADRPVPKHGHAGRDRRVPGARRDAVPCVQPPGGAARWCAPSPESVRAPMKGSHNHRWTGTITRCTLPFPSEPPSAIQTAR